MVSENKKHLEELAKLAEGCNEEFVIGEVKGVDVETLIKFIQLQSY